MGFTSSRAIIDPISNPSRRIVVYTTLPPNPSEWTGNTVRICPLAGTHRRAEAEHADSPRRALALLLSSTQLAYVRERRRTYADCMEIVAAAVFTGPPPPGSYDD